MKTVSKEEFKEMYFKHGRGKDGWGQSYWDEFFEKEAREYRLFFLTEDSEESFFGR